MNSIIKKTKGFTLVELMVVVSIIGILASIAIPQYSAYINRAKVTEAISLGIEVQRSVSNFYKEQGRFPSSNKDLGIASAKQFIGNHISGIEVEDGAIHITFDNKVPVDMKGAILSIRPIYVEGNRLLPVSWLCAGSNLVEGMSVSGKNKTTIPKDYLSRNCSYIEPPQPKSDRAR